MVADLRLALVQPTSLTWSSSTETCIAPSAPNTRILQAQATGQPFLETFSLVLQDELDRRRSRLTERRYQHSGLDERLTLGDFDWRFNPKVPRQACFELHTLKFITEGINGLLIGKPGTGKSHIAKALAYQGTLQGYNVRYVEADTSTPTVVLVAVRGDRVSPTSRACAAGCIRCECPV